jgi:membrane-associated protease RseP (regulator of RpoE activity)
VRIHPFFWLVAALLALNNEGQTPPAEFVLWIVAMFASVLIHELGHAFAQRYYGGNPKIVLHGMGGLAICGDCKRSTWPQIFISLAGPGAGFCFAALLALAIRLSGHEVKIVPIFSFIPFAIWEPFPSAALQSLLQALMLINILWGAVNLLPVYPLDGGRVSRELCQLGNPRGGIILSLQISIACGAAMAFVGLVYWESLFSALLFGYLAYSSYRTLSAYRSNSW